MEERKQINIAELRVITEKMFQSLEEQGVQKIELTDDYYWSVLEPYEFVSEWPEFGVGQLSDDWVTLSQILIDEDRVVLRFDFALLASILRYVGEKAQL